MHLKKREISNLLKLLVAFDTMNQDSSCSSC